MALALPDFTPGCSPSHVDLCLRQAAAAFQAAGRCTLLWFHEALNRHTYRDLGYASMELYAMQALGFSRNRTVQFMRLARDLDRLPPLREAVVDGKLEWTKAQQVGRVATPETATAWVEAAAGSSRRDLERGIAGARRAARQAGAAQPMLPLPAEGEAPPALLPAPRVSIGLTFDSVDAARLEALIDRARKAGLIAATASREEAILAGLGALLGGEETPAAAEGGGGSSEPLVRRRTKLAAPYRVVMYRCRTCEQAEVVSGVGRRQVDAATAEAVVENAVVHDGGVDRQVVAPGVRERVLARDGHRCQAAGCGATRFLEVHHVVPRAAGGSSELGNLTTLCSRCHRQVHRRHGGGAVATAPRLVRAHLPTFGPTPRLRIDRTSDRPDGRSMTGGPAPARRSHEFHRDDPGPRDPRFAW